MEQKKLTKSDLFSMFVRSNLQQASFNFERIHGLGFCYDMIPAIKPKHAIMREAALRGFSTATDLADWLVREAGLPFRDAHHATGALVAMAEKRGVDLPDLTLDEMRSVNPAITGDVYKVLGVHNSVASRTSYGGTAPAQVRAQIARWKEKLV